MSKQESLGLNRIKILLLLLDQPMTRLYMQKFIFCYQRVENLCGMNFRFESHYLGQDSEVLERNLEELAQEGLIQEKSGGRNQSRTGDN